MDNLVLPVEIVALRGGVHFTPSEVDLGVLTYKGERMLYNVSMLNSGIKTVKVVDVITVHKATVKLNDSYAVSAGQHSGTAGDDTPLARIS